MWNRDEVRGKADQLKGRVKEKIGDFKKDDRMRDEGIEDQAAGEVESALGKSRRKVGDAIKDVGKKIGE
jgi:uncharacterized protein YjbJ (UPF0337 family)